MADIDLKTETPDTSLPTTGFLFGADSQAAASPSVYSTQTVATTLLGSTSLTGATITADAPVLDLSQTWNASGVTFTGLKFNVTDTASASGSLLMDLQVGGASIFRVNKTGAITIGRITASGTQALPAVGLADSGSTGFWGGAGGTFFYGGTSRGTQIAFSPNGILTLGYGSGGLRFASGPATAGGGDLILIRRGAANLSLGAADAAAPVAQTLSVQSVVAGTTNTAGANLTITGSQGTGTGAGGSIVFQVAPAGSSGTAQNALVNALTITSDKIFSAGGMRGQDGYVGFYNTIADALTPTNAQRTILFTTSSSGPKITLNANSTIGFSSATSGDVTEIADTILRRDAANTLALRNGTNAQTFNVYNTFTSSTNFERFRIFAQSAAAVLIGTEKGSGGGTARALELQTDATTRLTIGSGGGFTIADAQDIAVGSTTGTKIGTATTQKIGFYNATPVVQPTAVADATDNATAITQLNALLSRMRDLGLIAT